MSHQVAEGYLPKPLCLATCTELNSVPHPKVTSTHNLRPCLGNLAFAGIIELSLGSCWMRVGVLQGLGWAGHRSTDHAERRQGGGVYQPWITCGRQEGAGGARDGLSPCPCRSLQKGPALPTAGSQTSGLQDWERAQFCCFMPPSLCCSVPQPRGTNSPKPPQLSRTPTHSRAGP